MQIAQDRVNDMEVDCLQWREQLKILMVMLMTIMGNTFQCEIYHLNHVGPTFVLYHIVDPKCSTHNTFETTIIIYFKTSVVMDI